MSSRQETHHRLERESSLLFDLGYFGELVTDGKWEELIRYVSGFAKAEDQIFFKIYSHMYLEALYKQEHAKALWIYKTNLQVFCEPSKDEHFKEIEHLLNLADVRENTKFSGYRDTRTARCRLLGELKKLIRTHAPLPLPHPKLAELRAPRGDEARLYSDRAGTWNMISQPSQCLSLRLPDEEPVRVTGLLYNHLGGEVLALGADGKHKLWQWPKHKNGSITKATASVLPQLCKRDRNPSMTNDIRGCYESIASVAISRNDGYVLSTSGGAVSLFNKKTFRNLATPLTPPPRPTSLAFDPENTNIAAIGMENCSVVIYDFGVLKVSCKIKGHHGRVTGLAFSGSLNVLVSACDHEIIVWKKDKWEKETGKQLRIPGVASSSAPLVVTRLQFHRDQKQLLVINNDHLAVFEAPRLAFKMQWHPLKANGSITNATYSCDGQQIYVTQEGGNIVILTSSSPRICCQIHFTAYMALCSSPPYPVMVAAHPSEPNQFAFGLTDGRVYVIQPIESAGKWLVTACGPSTSDGRVHLKQKGKRKLDSSPTHKDNTNPPKRRSSAQSLRTKPTREQEIKAANTSARHMLCNSEYHKDDPVISRWLNLSEKIIEVERDSEPNPGEKLKVKTPLDTGQTMEVQQGCDPKLSRKSEEKRLLESSQTIKVEQKGERNPSGDLKEKGQLKSSHKLKVEQDGEPGEMSEVEHASGAMEERH
ncbi:topless-related protein 4-like protein isoform X1 [Tanacetum coccineum]